MSFWDALPQNRLLVEASLWSADFTHFADEMRRMEPFADLYHFDVSDGHFVPGLLFFPDLVAALRPLSAKPFHVHLMATNPLDLLPAFLEAGASLITVHAENGLLAPAALQAIRQAGAGAGLALGLDMPPEQVLPYLEMLDLVVMMGTLIGVKGVEPSPLACQRLRRMRALVNSAGLQGRVKLVADGGIRRHTVPELRCAGADVVVAGSLVYKSANPAETFAWLHSLPAAKDQPAAEGWQSTPDQPAADPGQSGAEDRC
jgi:ribulose-phosphate 3-epimerase